MHRIKEEANTNGGCNWQLGETAQGLEAGEDSRREFDGGGDKEVGLKGLNERKLHDTQIACLDLELRSELHQIRLYNNKEGGRIEEKESQ